MSAGAFIAGLLVLMLLLAVPGFGVGLGELAIWLVLVAAWITLWRSKRRTA